MGADQNPCLSGTTTPRTSGRGHGAEPAMEHGVHECRGRRSVPHRLEGGPGVGTHRHPEGAPRSITVDNGSEFASRVMDAWAYRHGIQLDFIRLGKPDENGLIESFNGRLRDECLNVEVFFTLEDVREKLTRWREDYNHQRPHSSLQDETPAAFATGWSAMTRRDPASSELLETLT